MKKLGLVLILTAFCSGLFATQTVCVMLRVGNTNEKISEPVLRSISDQFESGILDYFFEQGSIVTTMAPKLSEIRDGGVEDEELGSLLWTATQSRATVLFVASVVVTKPPKDGLPLVQTLIFEQHDLLNPKSVQKIVRYVGESTPKILKELSRIVSSML